MTDLPKWLFECKKSNDTLSLHWWIRRKNGTAYCKHCAEELNIQEAANCFRDPL